MLITNEAAWLENLIDFAEHNKKQFAEWLKDFGHKRKQIKSLDGVSNANCS